MRRHVVVASAVASWVRVHVPRVGRQASSRTTILQWIGSLNESGRPVTDAIKRFDAVSSLM